MDRASSAPPAYHLLELASQLGNLQFGFIQDSLRALQLVLCLSRMVIISRLGFWVNSRFYLVHKRLGTFRVQSCRIGQVGNT
jgi:hypothetical protein